MRDYGDKYIFLYELEGKWYGGWIFLSIEGAEEVAKGYSGLYNCKRTIIARYEEGFDSMPLGRVAEYLGENPYKIKGMFHEKLKAI